MHQSIPAPSIPQTSPTMLHVAQRAKIIRDDNLALAKQIQIGMAAAWMLVPSINVALAFFMMNFARNDTAASTIFCGALFYCASCGLSALGLIKGDEWKKHETETANALAKAADSCIAEAEQAISLEQAEKHALELARSVCHDAKSGLFARSLQAGSTQRK